MTLSKELFNSRVLRISAASLLTGMLIGVVGGSFRLLLMATDSLRDKLVTWAHGWPLVGWIFALGLGLTGAALARLLVVLYSPEAEGSGIQRVEAVFSGEIKPAKLTILPVKFFGGLLAIGSGLALGREGPTVQMGASLSTLASRHTVKNEEDARIIDAAGAGAGLAVAFNAPIGGSIFVFEELTSNFTPWLLVGTLASASLSVWIMRLMLGNHLDFVVKQVSLTLDWRLWWSLVLGTLLGAIGALYNSVVVHLLRFADGIRQVNSIWRAAFIGATVGLVAWFAPTVVGGGDNLTQAVLSGHYATGMLAIIVAVRFFIGPWSYAARAPGGLFAPMLVLGASLGALFGVALNYLYPTVGVPPLACAVVGMGALFSACVRAPLTGIVLTVEMTGRGDLTLALLSASLLSMVVTALLNSEPIYVTLRRRMLEQHAPSGAQE